MPVSCRRFLALLVMLLLCPVTAVHAQSPGASVIISPVEAVVVDDPIEAHGTLKPREAVTLSATVTEVIDQIHFDDAHYVNAGDLLVRLDDREEQAKLKVKQAQLVERENELARARGLQERNLGSRAEVEDNAARLAETRAEIEEIRVRLQRYQIHAPFDGVVGLREISRGMLVSPGSELVRIVAVDPINLDFTVPELFLNDLTPGLTVRGQTRSYPDEVFSGVIEALQSEVDAQTRSITVRASLENPEFRLRPGQFMQVEIARDPREVRAIPESGLVPEGNRQSVFVLQENDPPTVRQAFVEIGTRFAGKVEITAGLKVGEQVVVHGVQMLREGSAVNVVGVLDNETSIRQILQQNRNQPTGAR